MVKSVHVSAPERDLLTLITKIEYGEIVSALVPDADRGIKMDLDPHQSALIEVVRENPSLDRIMVHDSKPQYVEVSGEWRGEAVTFRYKKKIKIV
jgi:hypothetical protein